jgi:NitT/TauT family transport system permease protein
MTGRSALRDAHPQLRSTAISARAAETLGLGHRRVRRGRVSRIAPLIGIATFFVVWETGVRVFHVRPLILPPPSEVVTHMARHPGFYVHNGRVTAEEALLGLTVAFTAAFSVGAVMAQSRVFERTVLPLAVVIQVTPIVAIAPAVVTWLGFGLAPKVVISAVVCFVPFLVNTVTGLRAVDPAVLELFESVGATRATIFRRVRVPYSLPYLFAAAKIAVGLALVGAVIGEWFGSTDGLGYEVKSAQARLLIDQLWGSIFSLALIGVTLTLAIAAVERIALRWHSTQTSV